MEPIHIPLPEGLVEIHPHCLQLEVRASAALGRDLAATLAQLAQQHLSGAFGLLVVRLEDSSLDPMLYGEAKRLMPELCCVALVSERAYCKEFFPIEQKFMTRAGLTGELFTAPAPAQAWLRAQVAQQTPQSA